MNDETLNATRRDFLRFLAASPALGMAGNALGQSLADPYAPQVIRKASDAINVFDFHEVIKTQLRNGHYIYMATGADDGGTVRANREGFKKIQLRMRRLADVRQVDTSIELFGQRYPIPVMLAPCGSQKAFHPEGELAAARAARSRGIEQMLSTVASTGVEDVSEARGRPIWFQLYADEHWESNVAMVRRAENAGCPVLVLTVDNIIRNREAVDRYRRDSNPECQVCHAPSAEVIPQKPMLAGLPDRVGNRLFMNWDFVDRLRATTSMKLLLKGIVTREDAMLAVEHGVDGVIVSNHGGRAEDSGRSTIESLPEVADAMDGRLPIILDSGVRRGTDIIKALALGADAVAIGRPYLWGLSAFG
ncbi:MAG: alpha-hydroxy acid oxidase, partial [Pseudomonadota bacterium]